MQQISKIHDVMTAITINIPDRKVSFFKKLIAEMGWTYEVAEDKPKTRLYDPETGEYLNDKTMKAIWISDNFSYSILVRGQGDLFDTFGLDADVIAALVAAIQ